MSNDLPEIRKHLDDVDLRILEALAERQHIVRRVAELKAQDTTQLRDVLREEDQLTRLTDVGRKKGLDVYYVTRLFREILERSVRFQQEFLADQQNPDRQAQAQLVVAFQGTAGAYSQLAAGKYFGPRGVEFVCRGYDSFKEILEAVNAGDADYAMLPIENTTAGSINEAYDLLSRMNLALVGEEVLRVEHCLVALEDVPVSHIRRIYSHPQALAQCGDFLSSLEHCAVVSFTDTAMSVKKIRDERDLSQAAIASEEAAKLYGLHVIKRDIANQRENYTRFVVVAREPVSYDLRIPCKTSLIVATRHEEGALLSCLNVLAHHKLNLTKLESRPRPNVPWEYLFYMDFEGNLQMPEVQAALQALAAHTSHLQVLGSYPARTTRETQPAQPRPTTLTAHAVTPPGAATPPERALIESLERKPYRLASRAHRLEDTHIHVGSVVVGGERPVFIAGPAFVESQEQIAACARSAKEAGADLLRGSCLKSERVPGPFQRLDEEALSSLVEAGRAVGMPVVTEVADAADVEQVARQVDVLLVGSRNMLNYALLEELGRAHRPILLERGMLASIDEWLTAAEFILSRGNQQVILCERGIRTFETATRTTLDLSAVPVVRERSHLPILVDPSQACGSARWVPSMVRAALAVGAHGVMVEMHPDPSAAVARGEQALSFADFERLLRAPV